MKEIHLTFLTGTIDTAKTVLDSVIVNVSPSDKYFNDLMELKDLYRSITPLVVKQIRKH
ncbi:MAG: hypothetical protein CM1200mP10_25330 [Candidatus Neomarinimicrobiota bacterium]|nr:MAG: hypothetical protein CM1200mP10_25330 [Candidatus Neomarinimicrobiota bacterium]